MPPALAAFEVELHPYRQITIRYQPSKTQIAEVLAAVREAGLTILDLTTEQSDLEDIFLALTRDEPAAAQPS